MVFYAVGTLCSLPLYADGLLKLAVFVALYAAWSALFRPTAYQYFLTAAKPILKKVKGKKEENEKANHKRKHKKRSVLGLA